MCFRVYSRQMGCFVFESELQAIAMLHVSEWTPGNKAVACFRSCEQKECCVFKKKLLAVGTLCVLVWTPCKKDVSEGTVSKGDVVCFRGNCKQRECCVFQGELQVPLLWDPHQGQLTTEPVHWWPDHGHEAAAPLQCQKVSPAQLLQQLFNSRSCLK